MDGWAKVPDVLLLDIYSYISFNDKLAASSTCKHWRELLFHPVNWSQMLRFNYFSTEEDDDRRRENFLKFRTGHFIRGCYIALPTEPQLLADSGDRILDYSTGLLDTDVSSLLQYLCVNKNLSSLTLAQAHLEGGLANDTQTKRTYSHGHENFCLSKTKGCHCSHAIKKGVPTITKPYYSSNNNNNDSSIHNDNRIFPTCNNNNDGAAFGCGKQMLTTAANSNFCGMLTRSMSQRLRDKSMNFDMHIGSSIGPAKCCCSKDVTNISLVANEDLGTNPQYIDFLRRIISTANSLTHLSLGFLPSITAHNNEIVRYLAKYQSESIKSLHLSRCQEEQLVYQPVELHDLLTLSCLQHLSLDTADLSDQLLVSLSEGRGVRLESLTLCMFNHKEGVRPIRDRTWDLLHQSCPNLVLTLNIVRCPEAIRDMMIVVNGSMPLTHLRVLFCDEFYVSGFHHIARHQASTLRSLQIIESMREGPMYYDIGVDEQDPFVMMAWRCKKLSSFSVIGIALREHDVLAVARLRGMQLTKLEVLEECITAFHNGESEFEEDFSMSFETFCEEISTSIGKQWLPLTDEDVHDSIMYFDSPESGAFLPVLMKDQNCVLTA